MSYNITDLPYEMIEQIFRHLQHRERLLVSCTCKTWRKLVFSPKFCKSLYLHFRCISDIVLKLSGETVSHLCRNAVISCVNIPDDQRITLITYFQTAPVESLKIATGKETAQWILEQLAHMKRLETLYLQLPNCDGEMIRIRHPVLEKLIVERMWAMEIDCPKLSALECNTADRNCVDVIKKMNGHLKSLKLLGSNEQIYTHLSEVEWENLKELHMLIVARGNDLENLLERMPRLKKLVLHDPYTMPSIGKELKAAKSLSELVLVNVKINEEFIKSLEQLTELESLTLNNTIFNPLGKEQRLSSRTIKRFTFVHRLPNPLPLFPNLVFLDLQCGESELCETLKDLCLCYPKLERLSFGVAPGQIGVFQPESKYPEPKSLVHLKKLAFLKTFQLNRLAAEMLDWSLLNENRIECLRFDGCSIDGRKALQIIQYFKHLRQLFLDHCYLRQPRIDIFELEERCVHGLRSQLPACAVSLYDCHLEELRDPCGCRKTNVV